MLHVYTRIYLLCAYVDTFILQNCNTTSPSIGTIRVSCDSSHQIKISLTCLYYCTNPMVTRSGIGPFTITDLDTGTTYFVHINVFDGNQVVLKDQAVTKNITFISTGKFEDHFYMLTYLHVKYIHTYVVILLYICIRIYIRTNKVCFVKCKTTT